MFLIVFFDLPNKTAQDRKAYTLFRRRLQYAGFQSLQYSVYVRDCPSHEAADKHTITIQKLAPDRGRINILRVTEAQMSRMINIDRNYQIPKPKPAPTLQLTFL